MFTWNGCVAQNKYAHGAQEFQTSNNFYHQLTDKSQNEINTNLGKVNPVLEQLDPSAFEVAAKKKSQIWETQQYRDADHREQLNQTTNRGTQNNIDPEIMEKLRTTKHNIKVTNISEYSNALNRGRVFINPKFSSC